MEALCWFTYNGISFHWQLLNFQQEIAKGVGYNLTLQIVDPPPPQHFIISQIQLLKFFLMKADLQSLDTIPLMV